MRLPGTVLQPFSVNIVPELMIPGYIEQASQYLEPECLCTAIGKVLVSCDKTSSLLHVEQRNKANDEKTHEECPAPVSVPNLHPIPS